MSGLSQRVIHYNDLIETKVEPVEASEAFTASVMVENTNDNEDASTPQVVEEEGVERNYSVDWGLKKRMRRNFCG